MTGPDAGHEELIGMDKPQEVKWAVFLLYTNLGIGVVQTVAYASDGARMVLELFSACLVWALVYSISKGRSWARILYLIIVVFSVLVATGVALHGFEVHRSSSLFLDLASGVAVAAGLVLLFGKPASQWFRGKVKCQ